MRRLFLLPILAWSFAGGGSSFEAEGPTGTLAGQISIGPFCPVEIEGQPCPPPPGIYQSVTVLVYAANSGRFVADTRPDSTGHFEFQLPSGSYRVALEHSIGIPGGPNPVQTARVEAGATTSIAFEIDRHPLTGQGRSGGPHTQSYDPTALEGTSDPRKVAALSMSGAVFPGERV